MSEYNNFGVPYYAHPDTPAIRGPRSLPSELSIRHGNKADKMKALKYVREFVKTNWKEGDKFIMTGGCRKDLTAHPKCRNGQSRTLFMSDLVPPDSLDQLTKALKEHAFQESASTIEPLRR